MEQGKTEIKYPPAAEVIIAGTDKAFCLQSLLKLVSEGRMSRDQATEYSQRWFGADLEPEASTV